MFKPGEYSEMTKVYFEKKAEITTEFNKKLDKLSANVDDFTFTELYSEIKKVQSDYTKDLTCIFDALVPVIIDNIISTATSK